MKKQRLAPRHHIYQHWMPHLQCYGYSTGYRGGQRVRLWEVKVPTRVGTMPGIVPRDRRQQFKTGLALIDRDALRDVVYAGGLPRALPPDVENETRIMGHHMSAVSYRSDQCPWWTCTNRQGKKRCSMRVTYLPLTGTWNGPARYKTCRFAEKAQLRLF